MKLFKNYRKNKHADAQYFTPDFDKMLRIVFWNSLGFFFFGFIIPQVADTILQVGGRELGFIWSAQIFGALLSSPLSGWLTDKILNKKLLVLIGSIGRGSSYLVIYSGILLKRLEIFVIGAFILGFSVALFWPPLDALISQKSYKTKRSYAFGRRFGLIGLGNLVGSIISIGIFASVNYYLPGNLTLQYSPLILFFLANIYAGIIFYKKVDENITIDEIIRNGLITNPEIRALKDAVPSHDTSDTSRFSKALFIAFLVFGITVFFSSVNQTIAEPFTQIYVRDYIIPGDILRDWINSDDVYIMLIYFPGPVLGQILSPLIGKICDKIKPTIGMPIVSTLGALFTLILINLINGWSFGILLLVDISFAMAGGLIFQNFLSRVSKAHRGKIFGMVSWLSRIGATIGPIIGGFVFDLKAQLPFIISIFVELALIIPFIISLKLIQPHLVEKIEIPKEKAIAK
ncbi:MAG: MFS transporter [Candidatus Lokiarchaeota archaeon]|nr:MFS transporter [Candidatus Lokiarchaeota archaeon]